MLTSALILACIITVPSDCSRVSTVHLSPDYASVQCTSGVTYGAQITDQRADQVRAKVVVRPKAKYELEYVGVQCDVVVP